jgi:Tfp pilus assembly protein PilZ
MFFVTALDRTIDIYADEDSALNSFKEDRVIENIKKMQLRRRFKRLPIDIKIELRNKTDQGLCAVKVDTLNLSAIGAYIYGCDKFKLGDEVILKFKLPPKQEEMELQAKVVWLSDKQIQPHIHPGIAVEFTHLSGVSQEKLLEFIERNLSFLSTND